MSKPNRITHKQFHELVVYLKNHKESYECTYVDACKKYEALHGVVVAPATMAEAYESAGIKRMQTGTASGKGDRVGTLAAIVKLLFTELEITPPEELEKIINKRPTATSGQIFNKYERLTQRMPNT